MGLAADASSISRNCVDKAYNICIKMVYFCIGE